ncbi:MAG TPA: PQQ-binding-like beta-propeller repeat protein [Gemmataceae bacterium]|nr:PQQ-binding-like beta-propeller repeat protein [Gemmataceae bacterium]
MTRRLLILCAACSGLAVMPALADDYPQWRGPNRDGVSKEKGLLQQWPAGGPKLAWKATSLGNGYSTPSIAKGQVYLISTTDERTEQVVALNEKDGKQLWSTNIGRVGPNTGPQYPGPRSTPTVDGERLYALRSNGELACLDIKGQVLWKKSLRSDFGGKPGAWAYAESPLVDGDVVVCTPGGSKATLVALNKTDGKVVWRSAVPGGDASAYASVVGEVGGIRQYIQFLGKGVVGVDAKTGRFLWRYSKTSNGSTNIPTPIVHDNTVFSTAQKTGAGVAKLTAEGQNVTATSGYFVPKLKTHIGGVVLVDGYVYGANDTSLLCLDFKTGAIKWEDRCVGKGSICYADGCLDVRAEKTGTVALVERHSPQVHGCWVPHSGMRAGVKVATPPAGARSPRVCPGPTAHPRTRPVLPDFAPFAA